jgi:hypothetical protein
MPDSKLRVVAEMEIAVLERSGFLQSVKIGHLDPVAIPKKEVSRA